MKRFYAEAVIRKHDEGGFAICLDGRPVKTPHGEVLRAPTEELANTVAMEWQEQAGTIIPDTMPLTQLLYTTLDKVMSDRDFFVDGMLAYLDTDLICYRAEKPAELARRQREIWDPVLAWFSEQVGVDTLTTCELKAVTQPVQIKENARILLENMDDYQLTVIQMITALTGSFILGLALVKGRMTSGSVFAASHVEENYKSEVYNESLYGKIPQQERREAAVLRDLEAGEKFLQLLQ